MNFVPITGVKDFRLFQKAGDEVYNGNLYQRGTEQSLEKLLILGPTKFHQHATVKAYVIKDGGHHVGRFALIQDHRLHECVQMSFFEALPDLNHLVPNIKELIRSLFPRCLKVVAGLNGHLNYGAGFLLNTFDEPPVFGLPYSQNYYPDYFQNWKERKLYSFRITVKDYVDWSASYTKRPGNELKVRFMNKKQLRSEIEIYTKLNNACFTRHPYWAERDVEEDMELFYPFRFLLDDGNLVFAEVDGEPVGFFLWYPDFNELVNSNRDLNLWDVIRFRLRNPIDTCRFTEIGIVPAYQGSPVALSMIEHAIPAIRKGGYTYCEIGFIFDENRASMVFLKRFLERFGMEPLPHKHYAVFEDTL